LNEYASTLYKPGPLLSNTNLLAFLHSNFLTILINGPEPIAVNLHGDEYTYQILILPPKLPCYGHFRPRSGIPAHRRYNNWKQNNDRRTYWNKDSEYLLVGTALPGQNPIGNNMRPDGF